MRHFIHAILFFFSALVFLAAPSFAQERTVNFDHIGLAEGLVQRQIYDIVQDARGYVWFATQSGLAKYDGYEFTLYTHDPENPRSIADNFVARLCADGELLWVGLETGELDRFNPAGGIFEHLQLPGHVSANPVRDIRREADGRVWVCFQGAAPAVCEAGSSRLLRAQGIDGNPHVLQSLRRHDGSIWLSLQDGGLLRSDPQRGRTTGITGYDRETWGQAVLHETRAGNLIVGTWGGGLVRWDDDSGRLLPYSAAASAATGLRYIQEIAEDDAGNLWIATPAAGLFRISIDGSIEQFRFDPADQYGLAADNVQCLYIDRSETLWAGTVNGISKYSRFKYKFHTINLGRQAGDADAMNYVFAICPEGDTGLWIGSMLGGVIHVDRAHGAIRTYDIGRAGTQIENTAYALRIDSAGDLYVGTADKGLLRLPRGGDRFEYLSRPMHVAAILEDSEHELWLATTVNGLCRYDRTRKSVETWQFDLGATGQQSFDATTLLEDRHKLLWIGTDGTGLIQLSADRKKYLTFRSSAARPDSLSDNRILSLCEGADGSLWVGTRRGLNHIGTDGKSVQRITGAVLRDSDAIYGILRDDRDQLWLSTGRGLIRFDPANGSGRVFTQYDGLLDLEFNQGAYAKSADGELFFGGGSGLYTFRPEDLQDNPHLPSVVITSFRKLGVITPFSANADHRPAIELGPDENYFSFEFAALDYAETRANHYTYMLENADKDWVSAGNRRSASYIQVPPGSYTFRVRGSNNDGLWNEAGAAVSIIVHPPFWMTWEFRFVAFFVAVALLVTFYRVRMSGIEKQRNMLQKEVDERRTAEARLLENQDRLRSLATQLSLAEERERRRISIALHDQIGHALSLSQIKLAALAHQNENEPLHGELQDTIRLISEAIDNTRSLTVDISPPTLYEFGFVAAAENLVERLGKRYSMVTAFETPEQRLQMSDEIAVTLYQILRELVVNVIKHAQADMLKVSVRRDRGRIVLRIKDNGVGFDVDAYLASAHQRRGLGLYSIRERLESMGGKLAITSKPGKGSEVKVTAPMV